MMSEGGYILQGRHDDARALFERGRLSDVGRGQHELVEWNIAKGGSGGQGGDFPVTGGR
jgi:hypothetical protein